MTRIINRLIDSVDFNEMIQCKQSHLDYHCLGLWCWKDYSTSHEMSLTFLLGMTGPERATIIAGSKDNDKSRFNVCDMSVLF